MNDITALAQREKFEAWFADDVVGAEVTFPEFEDGEYVEGDVYDPQLYLMLQSMWMAWQAASVALVEALEAEQQKSAKQGRHACELFDEVKQLQEQLRTVELSNSVLESRTVTVKLPDEVLRLAQAPQHLSKHDQLCWMSGANWMRMEVVKLNPAAGIQVIEGEGQ